jgi:hypothetical protein
VHIVDTVRIAKDFGVSPDVVETWSLEAVNKILAVYDFDHKMMELKKAQRR